MSLETFINQNCFASEECASDNHSVYSKMALLYSRVLKKTLLSFQKAVGPHGPTGNILLTQQQQDIPRLVNSLE